jgi:flagellar hook-associated protein 1 FlgK
VNSPPVTPNPAHPLTDLNLQQAVSITFNNPPTSYNVVGTGTGNPINVPYTAGSNISYNGWTVQIAGTPVAGDVFNVTTNTNAIGDNSNALLMAGLQTQNLMANGTASIEGVYSQLVGDIGATTHGLDVTSQAQNSMVAQTVASQQAVSGVNLDEEAANLLQYQRAYQASAKAMQIANTMFDALLAIHP